MLRGFVVSTIQEAYAIGFAHHQRGELSQAEQVYRQILSAEPRHADAWHLLGVAQHQAGRHAEAVQSISQAIAIQGTIAAYHNHLGAAHAALDQYDQAETSFRRALELNGSDAQIHYNLAALLNLRGHGGQAIEHYRKAIQLQPQFAEAHFNLGNLLRDDWPTAERCYAAAVAARPGYGKALMSLGTVQWQLGKHAQAEANWRQVLKLDPRHVEARVRLGSLLLAQQKTAPAVEELRAAVFLNPRHAEAQINLGCGYRSLNQLDQADQCFRLALAANPHSPQAWNNLGSILHEKKDLEAAVDCFRQAIDLQPDFVAAHNNLGASRQDQKKFVEAVAHYRQALELQPDSAETLANVGSGLQMLAKTDEAIEYHHRAIAIDPNHFRAHYSLAAAYHFQGREEEALASYAETIRLSPQYAEAYYNRSFVRLGQGQLAEGWQDYEWRLRCKDFKKRNLNAPQWDGSPLANRTLLIHCEQGMGDTLQFIRYVRLVEKMAGTKEMENSEKTRGTVLAEVQPALVPLLRTSGFTSVIGGGTPLPGFDVQIPMLSLPGVFRTTLDSIPADVPYLAADSKLVKHWRGRLRSLSGFKVGIVWQGNAAYMFDHFRSIPLVEFAPLAEVEGVRLISLQKNAGVEQLASLEGRFTAMDLGSTLDNHSGAFMDTAAVMCNLDLIITSDTAAAHLAGGLGVPVWLALTSSPEWRWMKDRPDSPWYPTMRLFRQPRQGDWPGVFAEMKRELTKLLHERSPAR